MKKLIKITALAIALIMTISLFAACKKDDEKNTFTTAEKKLDGAALVEKDLKSGNFYYATYDDGTATLTNYASDDEVVVVPSTIGDHKVTTIG